MPPDSANTSRECAHPCNTCNTTVLRNTNRHPITNNLIRRPPPTRTDLTADTMRLNQTSVFETYVPFSRYNSSQMSIRTPKTCHSKHTNTFINTNTPSTRQCSAQETHSIKQHHPTQGTLKHNTSHHNDASCTSITTSCSQLTTLHAKKLQPNK